MRSALIALPVLTLLLAPKPGLAGEPAQASYAGGFVLGTADGADVLRVRGFAQPFFALELGDEPGGDGITALGFRVRRGRISFDGRLFASVGYKLQVDFVKSMPLLDWEVNFALPGHLVLHAGQFKVPFSRQFLTGAPVLALVDRAFVTRFFTLSAKVGPNGVAIVNRDIGVALDIPLASRAGITLGVFNGNGLNTKGNDDTDLSFAGRIAWDVLGAPIRQEGTLDGGAPRLGVGLSAIADSLPGAGVPLQVGADVAFAAGPVQAQAELFYRRGFETRLVPAARGAYVQAALAVLPSRLEVAARYGVLDADPGDPVLDHEITAGPTLYLHGHQAKVQLNWIGTIRTWGATRSILQSVVLQTTVGFF